MRQVHGQFEMGVFDPIRTIQLQRHFHQPLPENAAHMKPRRDMIAKALVAHRAGIGLALENINPADMHGSMELFKIEKCRVQSR